MTLMTPEEFGRELESHRAFVKDFSIVDGPDGEFRRNWRGTKGVAMSTEYRDSTITNATSGLQIVENAADDLSLKIVSGDGTKNVTVVRYKGRTALADVQLAYQHVQTFLLLLGLDV